jgi:hypothetical protein
VDLNRGPSETELDLPSILKEIVEADKVADGFLVTVDPADGRGLKVQDLPRLQGLRTGAVRIEFRTIPAPVEGS